MMTKAAIIANLLSENAALHSDAATIVRILTQVSARLVRVERERAELLAALDMFDDLIIHQYTGSKEAMADLQEAALAAQETIVSVKGGTA